jgi:hypothetical protein
MKYLEDTLAEQCLSKTLYPNTKIHVRRKKVEGTLMTYTNDIEVEVDFSDVDPNLLDGSNNEESSTITTKSKTVSSDKNPSNNSDSDLDLNDPDLDDEARKLTSVGNVSRFFKKN